MIPKSIIREEVINNPIKFKHYLFNFWDSQTNDSFVKVLRLRHYYPMDIDSIYVNTHKDRWRYNPKKKRYNSKYYNLLCSFRYRL